MTTQTSSVAQAEEVERMEITPELALQILEPHDKNRRIMANHWQGLARQMKDGHWHDYNGDTIKFDQDGRLLDGQHRLLAVVSSGVTIGTYVVRGLDPSAFDSIDIGRRRSAGDILDLRGETNSSLLAASLHVVWRYRQGLLFRSGPPNAATRELEVLLDEIPDIRESMGFGEALKGVIPPALGVGLHYIFAQRNRGLADEFLRGLSTGIALKEGDPVRVLRERLIRERSGKTRLRKADITIMIVKAWNATRQGKAIKMSKARRSEGGSEEALPVII